MRILNNSSLLGAAVALIAVSTATAQVAYSENFDAGSGGWTGSFSTFSGTTACGGAGGAVRKNQWSGSTAATYTSPSIGTSFGGSITVSFDYKCMNWSANTTAAPVPWGSIDMAWSSSPSGPWTSIDSVTDEVQTDGVCITRGGSFTAPAGDVYLQFTGTWAGGDYYLNLDNVVANESLAPCAGTPAPGDTEVTGDFCNVGDSVTLSLQNATTGSGVSYQWLESADDLTYTPFGTDAPSQVVMPSGPTYYKCDVTCSAGPSTGTSNSVFVDYDVPAPGNTVASPTELCSAGDPIDLSLDGALPASATYQWYENGLPIVGATSDSYVANPVVTSTYYCEVTCGPNTVSSAPVVVDFAAGATFPQPFDTSELDNCWAEVNGVGDVDATPKWDAVVSGYGVGAGSVFYDFYSTSGGNVCEHISPIFSPVAAGTSVYFDVAGSQYNTAVDTVALEESSDGGVSWATVVTMDNDAGGLLNPFSLGGGFDPEYTPTATEWSSLRFDLSAGTNRIRFVATSDFGNNVYIDNVSVGVVPSARHIPFGTGCAGGYALSSATPPVDGALVTFDVTDAPEALLGSGWYFGVVIVGFGEVNPGVDLSTIGSDVGCFGYLASLDVLLSYVTMSPNPSVDLQLPAGIPAGTYLVEQAAAIVEATASNPAGLLTSNALRSLINTF